MVSIELMKHLAQYYDITLVSVSEIKGPIVYDTDDLKITSLNVPQNVCRFDEFLSRYFKSHAYIKVIKLSYNLLKEFIFKRHHYRGLISNMSNPDDLIIASSMDSYIYAPLDRKCVFHYHFNAQTYFSLGNQLMSLLARKSDQTVLLTRATYETIIAKEKHPKTRYRYIYNPSRFARKDIAVHSIPNFIFMGRLEKQKNPMCLLEVMNILKQKQIAFHLDILGEGSYSEKMAAYIKENNLTSDITLHGQVTNIKDFLSNSDINIMTSIYEGFPLSIIEASSYSLYNITTNWGDAVNEAVNGQNGIVIDSFEPEIIAEEIIKVLNQDLNVLKHQSYLDAKRFEFQTIEQEWLKLFKEIREEPSWKK